jgi:hypothetical protein
MSNQDEHIWIQVPLSDGLKSVGFSSKKTDSFVCSRCKCKKLVTHKPVLIEQFQRELQMYNEEPKCFGDTPINEQTID